MKKIFLIATVLVAALAVSCKKATVEEQLSLSTPTSVNVPVEGDVVSITFTSNVSWTAQSSASWLTVSPASGAAGEKITVKASALKNEGTDDRTAEVTITAGTKSAKVTVTQSQKDAMDVVTNEFTVEADGGEVEVTVSANVSYTVSIPEAVDWIHVGGTKGMADSKVVLSVDETHEYVQDPETWAILDDAIVRTAKITITAGALKQEVTVNQKAFVPFFEYTGDWAGLQWSFYEGVPTVFPQEGGTFVIPVNTNIDWRAYFSVYDASIDAGVEVMENEWCTLSFDTEENTITLVMQPNDSYFPREDYLYSVGIIDGEEDGNFGGLGWFQQAGIAIESAEAEYVWFKNLADLNIPAAYNRLAYTATGALLISDGEKVHAINPADGTYSNLIEYPGITPTSICSDDAGNVIVMSDVEAEMDWNEGILLSGTELTIYYSSNPNEMTNSIVVPNLDYGIVGGIRVRGNLAEQAVISGVVGSASAWFGYDIQNYQPVANYYGTQNQGPGPGTNPFWTPETAASISVGTSLHEGVFFRGYDGTESLYYLSDAYTPHWAVPYEWALITDAGSGGNENQNNLALVDYKGKRILAYTQGFHFDYSSNANIYVMDATDVNDVKPLVTINPTDDIEISNDFTGQSSADVLLHPTDDCLELYAINSGRGVVCKYKITF